MIFAFCILSCGTPYGIYHKVEKGQTLYSISRGYGVPLQELQKINRISDSTTIREGDAIFIPGTSREKAIDVTIDHKTGALAGDSGANGKRHTAYMPPQKTEVKPERPDKSKFIWPVEGKVISEFGMRNGEKHSGIDIKAGEGATVKAADAGKVIYSGNGLNGYGNLIIIKHEGTFFTVYAHNSKNLASEGDLVEKGDKIAEVGDTGRATTPHLHFEIRKNKVTVDPILYLP